MRGHPMWRGGEFRMPRVTQPLELFGLQKAVIAERADHRLNDLARNQLAGEFRDVGLSVERHALAVEEIQRGDEQRRYDQNLSGVAERVAEQQSGPIGNRRWKNV